MKTTLLFLSVFLSASLFGQITTSTAAKEKPPVIEPYDSLINFLGKECKKYKGQELYLIPKNEDLRKFGYRNFIKDINKSSTDKSNTFKCCDSYNSKYDEIQGKYFEVLDVLDDPRYSFGSDKYLKLKMKETDEITYFKYSPKFSSSFPFLVVGYYEKQKEIFVDNDVLIRPFRTRENTIRKVIDIDSGEEIELEIGQYVRCVDITIEDKYYETSLVLKNNNGQKFFFPLYARHNDVVRILTKEEAEDYKMKFGNENWETILNDKVRVGFTEEMVRLSWGEPKKINRSSSGDQWVYDSQYLYFENGKMRSFN